MKSIYLYPYGGLCNRLTAIEAARELSVELDSTLNVYWLNDVELGARYNQLFNKNPFFNCYEIDLRKQSLLNKLRRAYYTSHPHPLLKTINNVRFDCMLNNLAAHELSINDVTKLKKENNIFISSFTVFFSNNNRKLDHFIPIDSLRHEIELFAKKFDENTFGVHIRRTDNKQAIQSSPLSVFISHIKKHFSQHPQSTFYLSTDSEKIKQELVDEFKDKVHYRDINLDRKSHSGMQQAVIDLFLLSRCNMIYGSDKSSFSYTAADIGQIDITYVDIQNSSFST